MSRLINLADPECEPTDEEWAGFLSRAFAGVPQEQERALERIHEEIERLRGRLLPGKRE